MPRLGRYYKQFEALSEEEVNAEKRAAARARRAIELERVEALDLSRTTWPEFPPPAIVNAITFAARRGLHRYVDRRAGELQGELAHRLGVPSAQVVVGDGSAQLLSAAAQALLEPDDELVTPWPSYGLYPVMTRAARGRAVPVPGFGADAILGAVTERTRLVALCNPNDPTGELLSADVLDGLLRALPERVVLLLDEALRDYVDAEDADATLGLLDAHPRLLVFRTFSKAWGLAGLRVGYAVGGPDAEPLLQRLEPELGLNELGQAGALEALRTQGGLAAYRGALIGEEREALLEALSSRPLRVTPSQANVVWLSAPGLPGAELSARLAQGGVLVAGGGPLSSPDHVRVAVPHRPELRARLLLALDTALGRA